MSVLKIPMLLLKIPLLVFLSFLQAILNILDRLSGFCTGLLTLVLATAFVLPIKYVMRKSAGRSVLMGLLYAPPFFTLVLLVIFDMLGGYNNLSEALLKPEFAGLFALVTASLYAASFFLRSIIKRKQSGT